MTDATVSADGAESGRLTAALGSTTPGAPPPPTAAHRFPSVSQRMPSAPPGT